MDEKLDEMIRVAGAKLQIGAEQIFSILVAGQRWEGVIDLACLGGCLALLAAIIAALVRFAASQVKDRTFTDDDAPMTVFLGGTAAAFVLFIVGSMVSSSLLKVVAPEYKALEQIVETLK